MEKNYYEILELPLEPLLRDTRAIPSHIDQQIMKWNRHITGPKATLYKRYRELAPTMREALTNPATLRQQGNKALENEQTAICRFATRIAGAGGSISAAVFGNIVHKHPKLSEESILKLIVNTGIRIEEAGTVSDLTSAPPAPPAGMKLPMAQLLDKLLDNLPILEKSSVYELLGCREHDSLERISQAISSFRNSIVTRQGAAKDAANQLGMILPQLFADDASRKGFNYEIHRHIARKKLLEEIKILLSVDPPVLHRETYENFVEELKKEGLNHDEAVWFVYDECCVKRKAPFPLPLPSGTPKLPPPGRGKKAPPTPQPTPRPEAPRETHPRQPSSDHAPVESEVNSFVAILWLLFPLLMGFILTLIMALW